MVRFADAEHHAWFNPTLWQAVSPTGELEPSGRIFSVDEERVPCRYDDIIFQPETSFRVNVDSSQRVIHLRSISLMGQVMGGRGETSSTPPRHGPEVGQERKDQPGVEERGCAGRWGTPTVLQLHGLLLLLLWMVSTIFFPSTLLLSPPSLRCGSTGHLTIRIKKKKKKANMHGSNHLQMASSLAPRGCPFPRHVSATTLLGDSWGHLAPAPDLNMDRGSVMVSQLCFSTVL